MRRKKDSLLETIIEGIKEKKGKEIVSLNFSKIENAEVSHFVICEGDSTTHVAAIADSVIDMVAKQKTGRFYGKDGYENAEWIILDFASIFVHVFQPHVRSYYSIEELWADCPRNDYN